MKINENLKKIDQAIILAALSNNFTVEFDNHLKIKKDGLVIRIYPDHPQVGFYFGGTPVTHPDNPEQFYGLPIADFDIEKVKYDGNTLYYDMNLIGKRKKDQKRNSLEVRVD